MITLDSFSDQSDEDVVYHLLWLLRKLTARLVKTSNLKKGTKETQVLWLRQRLGVMLRQEKIDAQQIQDQIEEWRESLCNAKEQERILKLKEKVRARDGNKCVCCGMTGVEHQKAYGCRLHVHRILPGAWYTMRGTETRCRKCHYGVHGEMRRREHLARVRHFEKAV
jgi:hypothetical protein